MTDFALEVVRGGPLPDCPLPLSGEVGPVSYREGVEPPGPDMHVLGFAFEAELVLKRGASEPDARGAARWGSVQAVFGVTRHGLRLVEFRPRRVRPPRQERPLPPAMSAVAPLASDLLDDVQHDALDGWSLGEPDRRLLSNEAVWARIHARGPRHRHVEELGTVIATAQRERMGIMVGDLAVLVALPDGRLLSLALALVPHETSYALRADPIVEVGQVWPIVASTELR